jgi:hypothetical protein
MGVIESQKVHKDIWLDKNRDLQIYMYASNGVIKLVNSEVRLEFIKRGLINN